MLTFILSNPSNSNQLKTKLFINEINDKDSYVVLSKSPNYNLEMILINYFPQPNKKIFKWKFYGLWNEGSIKMNVFSCFRMLDFDDKDVVIWQWTPFDFLDN